MGWHQEDSHWARRCLTLSCIATATRTFRLDRRLDKRIRDRAGELGTNRTELVARLLDEGVRREHHPLLDFRWADGERRPYVGEADVARLIIELRTHRGDVATTANVLKIDMQLVDAALAYYQEFRRDTDRLIQREVRRQVATGEAREGRRRLLDEMARSPGALDTVGA